MRVSPAQIPASGSSSLRRARPRLLRVSQLPDMLNAAHALGLRRRHRVQQPLIGISLVLVGTGVACEVCSAYLRVDGGATARDLLLRGQTLCTHLALPCFLSSLQPGDARAVRVALVAYAVVIAGLGGLNANRYATMRSQAAAATGWTEIEYEAFVLLRAFVDLVAAFAAVCAAASPLSTRARIGRLWLIAGVATSALAAGLVATIAIQSAAGAYADQPVTLAGSLALACVYGLNAAFALNGRLRVRVQSCVERDGEAVQRAAIVAALIGRRSVSGALVLARDSFRAIRLDALCAADLASNDAASSARLHALSVPVQYGEVDAFVSHSWSDDPAAKWQALSEWGADFARAHGRPPRLWLDCACLDQTEFRSSGSLERVLACLPIYLAGSRRFLVLSGPSWHSRLWCLLEAFVWVQMHGQHGDSNKAGAGVEADVNRITMLLLGRNDAERAATCAAVSALETGVARCSTEAHRALLLEMIEVGCRGLHDFDVVLRGLLREALETAAAVERARAAVAATASERSFSPRRGRRVRRPSSETPGSSRTTGSWRDSISFKSILNRGRRGSPAVGAGELARRHSAEANPIAHARRPTLDGTSSGSPAILAEALTSARPLRSASVLGVARVSMASEGDVYAPVHVQLPPSPPRARRQGSEATRGRARTQSLGCVPAGGADRSDSSRAAALSTARDARRGSSPLLRSRRMTQLQALAVQMPDLQEDQQ